MNTYDLANRLEEFYSGTHITKAAEVLRTQQDEIEALKAENKFFKDLMGDVEILRKVSEA